MFIQRFLLFAIILFVVSCQNDSEDIDRHSILKKYYSELKNSNLQQAAEYIIESIIVSEAQFIQTNSKNDWFRLHKWDSVFSPNYQISDIIEVDGKLEATINKDDNRIRFLHETPIAYKVSFEFKDGKISKEHTFEYLIFDFDKWQSKRDSLTSWVDKNHPELSGFVYDQTIKGGQDYLQAIDYYESR